MHVGSKSWRYVLITPARNEAAFMETTLQAVVRQTLLPVKWAIVSDGSTDGTDRIVERYAKRYPFIVLLRLSSDHERNFAAKVFAIQKGFELLKETDFQFYGNLDGDVSFEPNYYEILISKFQENSLLGVGGGKVYDFYKGEFHKQISSLESVAGPIQFFRRECYEAIGGYVASREGLIDAIAEVCARMQGWETRTFPELKVLHHRKTSSEGKNIWSQVLREGKTDYLFGYHPLFHLARSSQRMFQRPFVVGSILRTCSYCWYNIQRPERFISKDFIRFLRKEQSQKLKSFFKGELRF